MPPVQAIVFRYLTNADFFNMYKPHGAEERGGGQTYIDFPTKNISVPQWRAFFDGVPGVVLRQRTQGPAWTVPVNSIGPVAHRQDVLFYRRRPQSVSIASQTLNRPSSNRVGAWSPARGFPVPADPDDRQQCPRGLAIFLVRTADNEIWAGWFLNDGQAPSPASPDVLAQLRGMLSVQQGAGIAMLGGRVWLDRSDRQTPFHSPAGQQAGVPPIQRVVREEPTDPKPRVLAARRERSSTRATDGRGYQLDSKRRHAVELYAMKRALEAYAGAEDTSATESYDLRVHEQGIEVRVEVKGTLGAGESVLVTSNEVDNALSTQWRTDLFIIHDVQLEERDGTFIASGGATRIIRGWRPVPEDLKPTQYRYRLGV